MRNDFIKRCTKCNKPTAWGNVCYDCTQATIRANAERKLVKGRKRIDPLPEADDLKKMAEQYRTTLPIIHLDAVKIRRVSK